MIPSTTVFVCFCIVAVYSIDGEANRKVKRDFSGLVSFPRIGRAEYRWKAPPVSQHRQSLVSFPRTGKRDSVDLPDANVRIEYLDVPWAYAEPFSKDEMVNKKLWALIPVRDLPTLVTKDGVVSEEPNEDTG